ncbi:rhodanese-like domain-containing protein [bacterium]|nr:MAG: rhodanese-like domain-containing protein [bacterium]
MDRLPEYLQNHPLLVGIAVVLAIAVLVYELRARGQGYAGVSPQEAIRLMNQGATVFDLRAAEAYAQGHITNAKPLSSDQLADPSSYLKKQRERVVIVVCENGADSGAAVRKLHAAGFAKAFKLDGGLAAWRAESLPLVRT